MFRQLLIVVTLVWAMDRAILFRGLHGDGIDPTTMLAFGFIVLVAYTLGELAERIHLPHISGYLLAGVAAGPHFSGLLSASVVEGLKLFDILAIALIALEAGAALEWQALRARWKGVLALTTGMIVFCIIGGLAFAGITSGAVPLVGLPFLQGQSTGLVMAVGGLVGVMMLAASPPVTMAVISETKSKGNFTETILTTVIINNIQVVVLFAIAMGVAHSLTGSVPAHGGGSNAVIAQLLWSLGLGCAIGALVGAVLRFLRHDALLAVVGLCFVGSWIAGELGASPLLSFLTAGVFLNTATKRGTPFRKVASTLSGPVYVLFFTLIGADLHLDALQEMAPYAISLVLLRLVAYFAATRTAASLLPLPESVGHHGWLGLSPQAGIALTVAIGVGHEFPGWGERFEMLGLAAIALNEMVGPILLKFSLNLSGDVGKQNQEQEQEQDSSTKNTPNAEGTPATDTNDLPRLPLWSPSAIPSNFQPWGESPDTGDNRLDIICRELQGELLGLVRDFQLGRIQAHKETGQNFNQLLRREFLRTHRRIAMKARENNFSSAEYQQFLQNQRGDLAYRIASLILDRGASTGFQEDSNAIRTLIEQVDMAAESLPMAVTGPLTDDHVAPTPEDPTPIRLRKMGRRLMRSIGATSRLRVIEVRGLARFHLSGQTPNNLHDLAGLLTMSERHLVARARNIFEIYDKCIDEAVSAESQREHLGEDADHALSQDIRQQQIQSIRDELEEVFKLANQEVDGLADEAVRIAQLGLGKPYQAFVHDLALAGTPSLHSRQFRFSQVYKARQDAVDRLTTGLADATELVRGNAGALAMELELVRLTEHVRESVSEAASEISRDIRGRVSLHLQRVDDAMTDALARLDPIVQDTEQSADNMLAKINAVIDPITHLLEETIGIAQQFHTSLSEQSPFGPLLNALSHSTEQLTDRFMVVFHTRTPSGRGLSQRVAPVPVPFRDMMRTVLEVDAIRDLANLAQHVEETVESVCSSLNEIDRILNFNTELARAELELLGGDPINANTTEVIDQTLSGVMQRLDDRIKALAVGGKALAEETEIAVRDSVLENLARFKTTLVTGRMHELRSRLTQRTLAQGKREIRGAVGEVTRLVHQFVTRARTTVGEETISEARRIVGIPAPGDEVELGSEAFTTPSPRVDIPIAYRRLFSDQALDAGDMLTGRVHQVTRVRRILMGEMPGANRAVSVISNDGGDKSAVVQALLRGIGPQCQIIRVAFSEEEAGLQSVQQKMAEAVTRVHKHPKPIIVVEGFQWLFGIRPEGFTALRQFVSTVIQTSDHVGWLVSAELPVWTYADRVVPLHDAFPEQVVLHPLNPEELQSAILGRHTMSGYGLVFKTPASSIKNTIIALFSSKMRRSRFHETAYFTNLHQDSGGLLGDAMRLWMASIDTFDTSANNVLIGTTPHPPIRAIRQLPDDTLITLRQVARQGRITVQDHAEQFRLEEQVSHAYLSRLVHWGLLCRAGKQVFQFHPELAGSLMRILDERGVVG